MTIDDIPWFARPVVRLTSNYLARRAKNPLCPKCGAPVSVPRPLPDTFLETRIDCMHCGHAMALIEIAGNGAGSSMEEQVAEGAIVVEKPLSTRILQAETSAERVWDIPAKGGLNFLTVFGTAWLLFCAVFNVLAFNGGEQGMARWGLFAFIGIFDLVGLGMLYGGLRMAFTHHRVRLTPSDLTLERTFAGRTTRKSIPPPEVTSVELVVFFTQNYEPVYGIEIRGGRNKMRFGSALGTEEKAWLCQDIRAALGLEAPAPGAPPAAPNEKDGTLRIEQSPGSARIVLPPARGLIVLWIVGIVFVLLPGFMLFQGIRFVETGHGELFFVLSNAFALLWCLGPAVFVLIGLSILFCAWNQSRRQVVITATRDGLVIHTQIGAHHREERLNVEEVQAVRAATSASWRQNGEKKTSAALYIVLPDRVRCLGTGQPPGDLQLAAATLRRTLGLDA